MRSLDPRAPLVLDTRELGRRPGSQREVSRSVPAPADLGIEVLRVPEGSPVDRLTNRAGGIEGGMTNGEPVRVRAAMKPISTVPRALRTIDTATGEVAKAHHQRSDVCAVPAAGIVAEAMVALVLADAVLEKFGGDSVQETARNAAAYLDSLRFR